ncbi:MAG: hypothetical protein F6J98_27670 [Moorea sp. SIO4G2]|nr:hypothetical protein [Moorena sp. SIO4G2]
MSAKCSDELATTIVSIQPSAVSRQWSAYFIQKLFPYPGLRAMAPQVACVAQALALAKRPRYFRCHAVRTTLGASP